MGVFKRAAANSDEISRSAYSKDAISKDAKADVDGNYEEATPTVTSRKFKVNKAGDGDAALALFSSPADVREPIDPVEEKKLVRKIDFMILP